MKKLPSVLSLGLAGLFPLSASPMIEIGDAVDVFATLSASGEYRSNVTLSSFDELEDFVWTVTPGVEANFGTPGATLDLNFRAEYGIVRFVDFSEFDSERWDVAGNLDYDAVRYTVNLSAGYNEREDYESDTVRGRTVVIVNNLFGKANGRYRFTEKTSAAVGVNARDVNYDDNQFNRDRSIIEVPVRLYREVTPKYDALIEGVWTQTDVENSEVFDEFRINVGLDGEVRPKLDGTFKVGYRYQESEVGDSNGGLNLEVGGIYKATPSALLRFNLFSRFGVGGNGDQNETYGGSISYSQALSLRLSSVIDFRYAYTDYLDFDRSDDNFRVGASLAYALNRYVSLNVGYRYLINESTFDLQDYDGHYVSGSVGVRY